MKLSTRKIFGLEVAALVLMVILLIAPVSSILKSYLQVAVLVGMIGASAILMGWAKPRIGDSKIVATFTILAAAVFQVMVFLLLGLKLGFVRNVYAWNFTSIFGIFLPVILAIVGMEILRGQLVERGRGSLPAVISIGVAMWVMTVLIALPTYNLSTPQGIFTVLTVVAGPAVLTNILLTYIAYAYDYRINIGYRLIMELPAYLLPVMPDAGVYLPAIFQIGLIFLLAIWLIGLHQANKYSVGMIAVKRKRLKRPETDTTRKFKQTAKWVVVAVVGVVVVGYVALMSGLFKYHLLAIGSGSMEPNLYRGDMVLVEKTNKYDEIEVGDILVYRHSNVIMVHRVAELMDDEGILTFITKGDANGSIDNWVVPQSDIIGTAIGKITAFGYPTLWLNELFNGGKI